VSTTVSWYLTTLVSTTVLWYLTTVVSTTVSCVILQLLYQQLLYIQLWVVIYYSCYTYNCELWYLTIVVSTTVSCNILQLLYMQLWDIPAYTAIAGLTRRSLLVTDFLSHSLKAVPGIVVWNCKYVIHLTASIIDLAGSPDCM